jgi:hypothetical protein
MEEEVGNDVGFSGIAAWLGPFRATRPDMAPGSCSDVLERSCRRDDGQSVPHFVRWV